MYNIAIFASGGGSNALKIIEHFKKNHEINVSLIVSNKKNAGVLNHAQSHNIESIIVDKSMMDEPQELIQFLFRRQIKLVVLAGYLWKIPAEIITEYHNRILNIHPSLLPKYGGKGMYGINVHKAVKAAGEKESGMTIHLVNREYDKGRILFQETTSIEESDSAEQIAAKVLKLEHNYYPRVIENYIKSQL